MLQKRRVHLLVKYTQDINDNSHGRHLGMAIYFGDEATIMMTSMLIKKVSVCILEVRNYRKQRPHFNSEFITEKAETIT